MTELRFSATQNDLSKASRGDERRRRFFRELARRGLGVELFVTVNAVTSVRSAVSAADAVREARSC